MYRLLWLLFCSWLFSFLVTWQLPQVCLEVIDRGHSWFLLISCSPICPIVASQTVILDCLSPCVTVSSMEMQWDPPSLSFSTLDRKLSVRLWRQKENGVECLSRAREVKLSFLDTIEYGKLSQKLSKHRILSYIIVY